LNLIKKKEKKKKNRKEVPTDAEKKKY